MSVLTTLGLVDDKDDRQQMNGLLKTLLPGDGSTSPTVADAIASRNAGKIAIEVARNLRLTPILQQAALEADSTLRVEAVRYSYYLWQHDRTKGFDIK